MASLSVFTWIFLLVLAVAIFWPIVTILRRMGFSGWWTLLCFVPFGSIVGLWILSRVRWPKFDGALTSTFE